MKTPPRGLLDRQGPPDLRWAEVIDGWVVKVNWADLQPQEYGPIAEDNPIDRALALVNTPDSPYFGMSLKLRVLAGTFAPDWAKTMSMVDPYPLGIPWENPKGQSSVLTGAVPPWWRTPYRHLYAQLHRRLAEKYDAEPNIRGVMISRCTTLYDEQFARQFADSEANVTAATKAGFTPEADIASIHESYADHAQLWPTTTSYCVFQPYARLGETGGDSDVNAPLAMMDAMVVALGERAGLQNNSLSQDKLTNRKFLQIYDRLTAEPLADVCLQTAAVGRIGEAAPVLKAGVAIGARSIELPEHYERFGKDLLKSIRAAMAEQESLRDLS